MDGSQGLLLLLAGVTMACLGDTQASAAEVLTQADHVQDDSPYTVAGAAHSSPAYKTPRSQPSPGVRPQARQPITPGRQETLDLEAQKPYGTVSTSGSSLPPPGRDSATDDLQHPQSEGEGGGSVDDVLAALVGYSHDPDLWRFVHSVVDELDYSRRARTRAPNHRRLPVLHLTPSHTRWWRAVPVDRNEAPKNWMNESRTDKSVGGGGGREGGGYGGVTSPAPPLPPPPPPQLPSNNQLDLLKRIQQSELLYNSQNASVSSRVNTSVTRSPTTHPPHFIFHKVYVDANYGTRTRQTYQRPVLAVMAVSDDRRTATIAAEDKGNDLPDTMDLITYHLTSDNMKDLPDISDTLSMSPKNLSKFSQEDLKSTEYNKQVESAAPRASEQVWRKVRRRSHKHGRFTHTLRKLYTFKSQIKFLQRWEEKLWHRSQHIPRTPSPKL
ncbi:uncharacterized protein [Procambarus clarkii]|uniref:uncharacterized protein n=1 Tax=Procambarus clarkii TaxID=6728 RepID=UPI003743E7B2